MNIYVGNLAREVSEGDLRTAFEAFGKVDSVRLITDKFTGEARGFGFVEMSNNTEAQAAIGSMNGKDLKGRALTVNEARPREERAPSGGGWRGAGGGGERRGPGGGGGGGFRGRGGPGGGGGGGRRF